jgi:hypothetical protein
VGSPHRSRLASAAPAPARLSSRISEYFRDSTTPSAPPSKAGSRSCRRASPGSTPGRRGPERMTRDLPPARPPGPGGRREEERVDASPLGHEVEDLLEPLVDERHGADLQRHHANRHLSSPSGPARGYERAGEYVCTPRHRHGSTVRQERVRPRSPPAAHRLQRRHALGFNAPHSRSGDAQNSAHTHES